MYTDGKRPNELRPFGETGGGGRDDATGPSLYSRTLSHSNSSHGTTPDAAMMMVAGDGGDGDGFDLDEVFGAAVGTTTTTKSTRFDLPPPSSDFDSQDSTRTVTQRMKRAYEGEDSAATLVNDDDDDDDMVATDVEDDGGDDRVTSATTLSSMFGGPGGGGGERRISGAKRAFGKTKSLPASAFHSMDF